MRGGLWGWSVAGWSTEVLVQAKLMPNQTHTRHTCKNCSESVPSMHMTDRDASRVIQGAAADASVVLLVAAGPAAAADAATLLLLETPRQDAALNADKLPPE